MRENGVVTPTEKTRKSPVRRSLEERRAELVKAITFHEGHIQLAKEKLAQLSGVVSVDKVTETTRKWLESLTTVQLRAHAQRVGIKGPENYEDLDDLIHDCLVQAGFLDEVLSTGVDGSGEEFV